jgi:hypothetical protein
LFLERNGTTQGRVRQLIIDADAEFEERAAVARSLRRYSARNAVRIWKGKLAGTYAMTSRP